MATQPPLPPWEYLRLVSQPSLQSYELTCLNHAANLRKEIAVLVEQWIENTARALLARWLLENPACFRATDLPEASPNSQGDLFAQRSLPPRAPKPLPRPTPPIDAIPCSPPMCSVKSPAATSR